jgi:hypothetical protein
VVHWVGGVHTELRVPGRRRGQQRKSTAPEIIEAVRMLACKCADDVIAAVLTRNDLRTGNGNSEITMEYQFIGQIAARPKDG